MLLEIKDVNKTYHSGKVDFQALYDINLSIEDEEFTAIAGPSGSGKHAWSSLSTTAFFSLR